MMQLRNMYLQNDMIKPTNLNINLNIPKRQEVFNIKQEPVHLKLESPTTTPETSPKNKVLHMQVQQPSFEKPSLDQYLKVELDKIITFLLANMGRNNQAAIDNFRKLYLHNPCLLQIYDKLVMKYFSAKKCREDIVRYILRKVFKVIRSSIVKKEKVCNKKASIMLCKKYFQKSFQKIQESGVNVANEDELIEFFMPYKKKSKNRTMNTNFVLEIFSSEEFCNEYQQFLADFENFLADDNTKKKEKLLDFLMECINKNSISKLGIFNRLPWLGIWMEDTKNIAFDLIPNKKLISDFKKTKINE